MTPPTIVRRGNAMPGDTPAEARPALVVIVERCASLARLIEVLVRERCPGVDVQSFADPEAARRCVAGHAGRVIVLLDMLDTEVVGDGASGRVRGWRSRAGRVAVVVLADSENRPTPRGAKPRPVRLAAWRACLDAALTA